MKIRRYPTFILAISAVLILALSIPANVVADDSTPPAPTEEVVLPPVEVPTEEPVPTEVQPTEEPTAPADEVLPIESPISTEAPESDPEPETPDVTVPELLASLPSETEIVIQVGDQVEPLATQTAAEAILVGDPIWCPDGVPPIPNTGGCTASYATLFDLIDDVDSGNIAEPAADGVIWITAGTDLSASAVDIDGTNTNFTTWSNFSLTIQGGWNGTAAGTITGSTAFSVPITIQNWGADVIVNDLSITTNSTGLTIETTDADIFLEDISSTNNTGVSSNGVELTALLTGITGGNVTITGTNNFSGNTGSGLDINADGVVDIANVTADQNGISGADITSLSDVVVSGASSFSDNTSTGLVVNADGDIDLSDMDVTSNDAGGAEIYAGGSVIISGTNLFDSNNATGLYVEATGDVDLENISATQNGAGGIGSGAEINTGANVSIVGSNIFDNNANDGLYIEAIGNIDAENISAETNGEDGVELYAANASILGTNSFDTNTGNGLYIETTGNIDAENLDAEANSVILQAGGDISITGINQFNNNSTDGLYAEALGSIDAENLTASGNGGYGADLQSVLGVTITGNNIFENNTDSGLNISVTGINAVIDVENISANDNDGSGAELSSSGSVVMSGTNIFEDNQIAGLFIDATGSIDIENITASTNGTSGAELNSLSTVTVSGVNSFDGNQENGLFVDAAGNVNLENISADSNGAGGVGNGLEVNSLGDLTLAGSNQFNNNRNSGLLIEAVNGVLLENITAELNGGSGAELTFTGTVTLSGINAFNNNGDIGIYLESVGNASVANLTATGNATDGANLTSTGGTLTIAGVNFFATNTNYGIVGSSLGDINAESISSSSNGVGAEFSTSGNFNLLGTNIFSGNTNEGMLVYAGNNIYIENSNVQNNGTGGLYLDAPGDATVLCSVVINNGGTQIDTDLNGYLILIGTDFGNDIDNNLAVNGDRLNLISNGCFNYPVFPSDGDDDDDDDGDDEDIPEIQLPPLPINEKNELDRQIVDLNCTSYSGTVLTLENGDSVYIPCPIIDSARLAEIPETGLMDPLPDESTFVSAFILDIYNEGRLVGLGNESGLVDFSSASDTSGSLYIYWNGSSWVEVTNQTFPFMSLIFVVPEEILREDLAILYWNGVEWVELTDGLQLGDGRNVGQGGHLDDKLRFVATVNFTGTFVLVNK
jgi:hypothetical protein